MIDATGMLLYFSIGASLGVGRAFWVTRQALLARQDVGAGPADWFVILTLFWPLALGVFALAPVLEVVSRAFMTTVRLTLPRDKR